MRLIYLPTGKKIAAEKDVANEMLESYPKTYIRAELPQYWRVEKYNLSEKWFRSVYLYKTDGYMGGAEDGNVWKWIGFSFSKEANFNSWDNLESYPQCVEISRVEFEYHIYNPWKAKQGKAREYDSPIINELLAEVEKEKENEMNWLRSSQEMNWLRSSQAGWLVDPANGLLKNPTKEYLQSLAESMGYELVLKTKWESEQHRFKIERDWINIWDKADEQSVSLNPNEMKTLIEKYNQFLSK